MDSFYFFGKWVHEYLPHSSVHGHFHKQNTHIKQVWIFHFFKLLQFIEKIIKLNYWSNQTY